MFFLISGCLDALNFCTIYNPFDDKINKDGIIVFFLPSMMLLLQVRRCCTDPALLFMADVGMAARMS